MDVFGEEGVFFFFSCVVDYLVFGIEIVGGVLDCVVVGWVEFKVNVVCLGEVVEMLVGFVW